MKKRRSNIDDFLEALVDAVNLTKSIKELQVEYNVSNTVYRNNYDDIEKALERRDRLKMKASQHFLEAEYSYALAAHKRRLALREKALDQCEEVLLACVEKAKEGSYQHAKMVCELAGFFGEKIPEIFKGKGEPSFEINTGGGQLVISWQGEEQLDEVIDVECLPHDEEGGVFVVEDCPKIDEGEFDDED